MSEIQPTILTGAVTMAIDERIQPAPDSTTNR